MRERERELSVREKEEEKKKKKKPSKTMIRHRKGRQRIQRPTVPLWRLSSSRPPPWLPRSLPPSLPSSQRSSPPKLTPPMPTPPPDFGRSNSSYEDEPPDFWGSNSSYEDEPSDFGRSNSMEAAIYRAAIAGDIDGLTTTLQEDPELNLLSQLTPRDDTILHIAARLGHDHLVELITSRCPDLVKSKNYNDDHPLHLAAAGGHLSIVQSLITNALRFAISSGREETEAEQDILDVMKGQNKQGNTPLHMAVKDHHYDVALFLFRRPGNEFTSCFPNVEKKSPLYMAAEAGHEELFELMMQFVASNVVYAQNMLKDGQQFVASNVVDAQNMLKDGQQFVASNVVDDAQNMLKDGQQFVASNVVDDAQNMLKDGQQFVDSNDVDAQNMLKDGQQFVASNVVDAQNMLKDGQQFVASNDVDAQNMLKDGQQFVASNVVDAQTMLKDGRPLLHVAITTRNKVVLETALKYVPSLIDAPDKRGRKPLSYAASIGYVDGICYILDTFVDSIYKRDRDGSYPIHEASRQGHIEVVKEFLRRFPDSRELLNEEGQNILHVAAKSGKANIVSYILKAPELEMLINDTDEDGNTPLLLATENAQAKIVSILTWDKRVRLEIQNGEGLTALDVSLNFMETTSLIHQRLTRMALRYASAPRGQSMTTEMTTEKDPKITRLAVITEKNSNVEVYKDRVNTLLLVATIIMTVTFAAGITVPGGYDDSGTHKGMALVVKKSAFQVFVIANVVAMYSSIIVAVLLIWAQLGDLDLIRVSLNLASPLFGGALMMVAISFMTGVYLVVSNLNWLSYVILIMGLIFVLALSTLLILLFLPASLNHRMLRYFFYYPFSLFLLIIQKWS